MGKKKCDNETENIILKYCGANGIVTGSCTYIEFPHGLKLLVDCGLVQDSSLDFEKIQELNSKEFDFDTKGISAVILTHGHL